MSTGDRSNPALKLAVSLTIVCAVFYFSTRDNETVVHQKQNTVTKVEKVTNSDDSGSNTAAEQRKALSGQMELLSQHLIDMKDIVSKLQRDNEEINSKLKNLQEDNNTENKALTGVENKDYGSDYEVDNVTNPNVDQSVNEALDNFNNGALDNFNNGSKDKDFKIETGVKHDSESSDAISWIGTDKSFFESINEDLEAFTGEISQINGQNENSENTGIIQYATLDSEAVLFDAFVFDTLIGVSPNQTGSVVEPYRFKVEISNQNLMTSGVNLPEIETMRMSGYAVGEWSAGCVRGYITSTTFVFSDGRISTFGGKTEKSTQGQKLAYITDEYGNPCLGGEKYSSLLEYASIHGGLNALASIGEGLSNAQFTSVDSGDGFKQVFTGDQTKLSLGEGLSGGLDAVSQTVAARFQSVKDIIVSKPERVVVHLTSQINIDYNAKGRKLLNSNFHDELNEYYEKTNTIN